MVGAGGGVELPRTGGLPVVEGGQTVEVPEEHLAGLVAEC